MLRRTLFLSTVATAALAVVRHSLAAAAGGAIADDPLLAPWTGPYGGFPRFDRFKVAALEPALQKAIDSNRAEIAAIASATTPATFDNTIAALEDAGRQVKRVAKVLDIYLTTMSDAAVQQLEREMMPVLAALSDEIYQNAQLFARIKAVHDARHGAAFTPEQRRLVELVHRDFIRHGAALGARDKAQLKQINNQLALLHARFGQNQLADEERDGLALTSEADLGGLPDPLRAAARHAAEARKLNGTWFIANTRAAMAPFLTHSTRRDLREKAWRLWTGRGEHPGEHDNRPVIAEIIALRTEKAALLGFPSYAHWVIDDNMARTPGAARALLDKVWKPAVARAREEIADMQKLADAEHAAAAVSPTGPKTNAKINIEPWDYRFYADKVRKAKYDLDQNDIRPYLQLDRMREAMMWVAGQLFGMSFRRLKDVPVYHPDVIVHEVLRNGKHLGLWYFDPYARNGKQANAWMNAYRPPETFRAKVSPIAANNLSFARTSGTVLISWDDARTLFRELGRTLYFFACDVPYPTLGTTVKRDFREFPSQLAERWLTTPEVLSRFALHHQTGKPIPAELVAKITSARQFNQGFSTVEYVLGAIYDLKIHAASAHASIDPIELEQRTSTELGCPPEITMRHRPTHFDHLFSSDEYAAGYYAYLWADTLTADAADAFHEAGGLYDRTTARRLYDSILRPGNSIAPEDAFRRFRGRDVDTSALMRDRGFPV